MNRQTNDFMSNLTQAARDNPLAAALIGGGALWLLLGNRMVGSMASGVASGAQSVTDAGMRGVSSAADAVSSVGSRIGDAVADGARSITRAAGEAASSGASAVGERVKDLGSQANETFSRSGEKLKEQASDTIDALPNPMPQLRQGYAGAQSALTDLFEKQPLVLGAIGLMIGAGVASAVASTAIENEWAGSLSDDVKDAVKGRAEHVAETAQRAAGEIGSDFRAAATEAADKLRKTGKEAVQTVRETADAGREF